MKKNYQSTPLSRFQRLKIRETSKKELTIDGPAKVSTNENTRVLDTEIYQSTALKGNDDGNKVCKTDEN